MLSLSVFIFAYNEEGCLKDFVIEMSDVLKSLGNTYEILIIDDGSTDATGIIADQLSKDMDKVFVIHHGINLGLGSVYKTAFSAANMDLVTFFCADGQFPASIIKLFMPLMNEYDMVLGYLPDRNDSPLSKMLSSIEKRLLRFLFGYMPRFQGIAMFHRRLLSEIRVISKGGRAWTILMEFIIRVSRAGYKIMSIPTNMRLRKIGKSKVNNISTIMANLRQAFILRLHYYDDK